MPYSGDDNSANRRVGRCCRIYEAIFVDVVARVREIQARRKRLRALSAKESAHIDQASQEAVRLLIILLLLVLAAYYL